MRHVNLTRKAHWAPPADRPDRACDQPAARRHGDRREGLSALARQAIARLIRARQALERIVEDDNRAREFIGRIRSLAKKPPTRKELLDIKKTVREVIAPTRGGAQGRLLRRSNRRS